MRKTTTMVMALVVLGVVSSLGAQPAATEDSLKLTHESVANAVKEGNLTLLEGLIHPNALGFFRESQMLVQLRASFGPRDALGAVVADVSRLVTVPYKADYRAIGDTGVVCITATLKDPNGSTDYTRATYVYVFINGNWRLLSWHTSQTPLKR